MENKQDKFSNVDDYDLILEEKEKELKKEKRNKRILASSLLLLLLLGSTAVVAPIISVAVNNKNNSSNINNIKIPSTLTFINSDITTLIDGYKSEIQTRKLSFDEFKQDFINLTKKHIVASNLPIGTIVKSAKITQNATTNDFNIEVVLDENKKYLTSEELTPATLNENTLTITFKENEKLLGDFFTPIEIDTTILDNLKDQIQSEIEKQKLTSSQKSDLDKLKTVIKNLLHTNQIDVPKYENPNLIIEPISPNKFTPSDSQWIVDGNIVIPNLKFFTLIKFSDLSKLFDALNNAIHTINNKHNSPEEFNQYTNQNLDEIKQLIYDNLGNFNKNKFNVDDILNISINENYELVIQLSTDYLRYQITNANENFELNNNKLIIKNLDFKYPWSPDSWFIYKYGKNKLWIEQLSDEGKKQSHIVIPSYVEAIYKGIDLENNENITTLDMSFMKNYRGVWTGSTIAYPGEMIGLAGCKNLEKIIFPKNLLKFPEHAVRETKIKNLIFPKSLTYLDTMAFYKCSNLKWVYLSSEVQFISATSLLRFPIRDTFNSYYTNAGMITIYVPTQELKQYYEQFNFNDARIEVRSTPPEN